MRRRWEELCDRAVVSWIEWERDGRPPIFYDPVSPPIQLPDPDDVRIEVIPNAFRYRRRDLGTL